MLNTRFPSWPSFSAEEAEAVRSTLLSNKVNYYTGNETRKFQCEFAGFVGTHRAVALANGTLTLVFLVYSTPTLEQIDKTMCAIELVVRVILKDSLAEGEGEERAVSEAK